MFRALRNLFGGSGSAKSQFNRDRNRFLRHLAASDVWVIVGTDSDGIGPATMTKEHLLEEIERAVKDLNQRDSFEPFVYQAEGQRRLPFFTSEKDAQTFVGEHSRERNRVYPFQLISVAPSVLPRLLPACDVLVMNDKTTDELVFSQDDMVAVERILGSGD